MKKNPYKKYWFSRRAIERLLNEIRPSIAYHIKKLKEFDVIKPNNFSKAACRRTEGEREVFR
jgi:hypothetical protein